MIGERKKRLEEAIKHLMSLELIDGKAISKSIAEKMDRGINGISSALNGDDRYLTWKFTKAFCAAYSNIISADWIWDGKGDILTNNETDKNKAVISEEKLKDLSRDELISLVKQLMILHNEQTEMYRLLIHQNEEMIRNSQERFNNITNIIFKNVQ